MKEVRADSRVFGFLTEQARAAMARPREGVDSGVLTAVALAETLDSLGATPDDRRRLARQLVERAADSADAGVIRARLRRDLASD